MINIFWWQAPYGLAMQLHPRKHSDHILALWGLICCCWKNELTSFYLTLNGWWQFLIFVLLRGINNIISVASFYLHVGKCSILTCISDKLYGLRSKTQIRSCTCNILPWTWVISHDANLCAVPKVVPENFELDPDEPVTSTSAGFRWDPVDTSRESMNGKFQGYKVGGADKFQVPGLERGCFMVVFMNKNLRGMEYLAVLMNGNFKDMAGVICIMDYVHHFHQSIRDYVHNLHQSCLWICATACADLSYWSVCLSQLCITAWVYPGFTLSQIRITFCGHWIHSLPGQ